MRITDCVSIVSFRSFVCSESVICSLHFELLDGATFLCVQCRVYAHMGQRDYRGHVYLILLFSVTYLRSVRFSLTSRYCESASCFRDLWCSRA